jgi:hypothetical protein
MYFFSSNRPATEKQPGDAADRPLQFLTIEVELSHNQVAIIMVFLA